MRMVTMCLAGLLVAAPLAAQEPQPEQRERQHVVRRGDTLWDLANHYLRNPFRWPAIYQANRSVVEDPHWIYPEEVLIIPGLMESVGPPDRPEVALRPVEVRVPARTVFYREPPRPAVDRPTFLTEAVETPLPVRPGEFHAAEFLADPNRLLVYGQMIRSARNIEMAGQETRPTAHPYDLIYLGYAGPRPEVGDRMMLVRVDRRMPELGRNVRVIRPTAMVRVTALRPEVIEATIETQYAGVYLNQLLVAPDLFPDFMGEEAAALEAPDLEGVVLEFVEDQQLKGKTARAFIDIGRRHGVQVGDVFTAYLPERRARNRAFGEPSSFVEVLPSTDVAELRVVRVGETTATVQVDEIMLPVLEDGIRIRRIRRMP